MHKATVSVVHKFTILVVHEFTVLVVHKITLSTVRIEPIKAIFSLLINIKPIQSCKTSKNIMIYLIAE